MDLSRTEGLPAIPLLELGEGGPLALFEAERARAEALLEAGRGQYPGPVISVGERLSWRWLDRSDNPYLAEIQAIDAGLTGPGASFLNTSYEWGCTTAVDDTPRGEARFLRVLDWPFDGLGAGLVAARFDSPAGPWINLTWPGFVGVVQAFAPGRFAACFNQAPLTRKSGLFALDWATERLAVWRRRGLPPAHLLRRAFETCPDYESAKTLLSETPIALPAIFVLCGTKPGEGCVIERLADKAYLRTSPTVATNHWQSAPGAGFARGTSSEARLALMSARDPAAGEDFAWLQPPILNATTRLALVAEPGRSRLAVFGIETEAPATAVLRLENGQPAARQALAG